uniref:Uncharacterized protein n=1 Tax=Papio anubis TaxID=9555 RepID=A0A8I5N4P3_PAPAN
MSCPLNRVSSCEARCDLQVGTRRRVLDGRWRDPGTDLCRCIHFCLMYFEVLLLEVWQVDEQIDCYKESQDKLLWQAAFIGKETLKDESGQESRTCRKSIYLSTEFDSVRQRLPKCYSWEKAFKT